MSYSLQCRCAKASPKQRLTSTFTTLVWLILAGQSSLVQAGPREQAKRMHDRIAGVPATEAQLTQMQARISAGNPLEAANVALANDAFYSITLKNWATPWTNEERTVFAPLNDYSATVIGMVRDDRDIREMLYGDVIYTARSGYSLPAYASNNNDLYQQMEDRALPLSEVLEAHTQSSITGLPAEATAGVLTTRAAAKAFLIDGTNRAQFRFTLLNHLCTDLEQLKDVERAADRIRQDVSRSPGGDSRIFMNACYGCHAGMDPMVQAFAYYDYDYDQENDPNAENGALSYNREGQIDPATNSRVKAKYRINANNFPYGYVTETDHWVNYWRNGQNQLIGWSTGLAGQGSGAKSMAQELAYSEQFASCQVEKVFKNVCLRAPVDSADRDQISQMVTSLKNNNYKLKQTFAEAAVYCMGE